MSLKAFISYSWDSEEHQEWVVKLANDLRAKFGYEVICDTIQGDNDLNSMMVDGITKSDKVIVVVTPNYTHKANNRIGGVGKETKLLYDIYFENPNKIIPILKQKSSLPEYLKSIAYIDFSSNDYSSKLIELGKKMRNEPKYKAVPISQERVNPEDYEIISCFAKNDEQKQEEFLANEFLEIDKKILSLCKLMKSEYPTFDYERKEKHDVQKDNCQIFKDGKMVEIEHKYHCITYKLFYNNKSASVRFWLNQDGGVFGNGIFGVYDESQYSSALYNSYNFSATIDRHSKTLSLETSLIHTNYKIKTGEAFGRYLFENMINKLR